MKSEICPVCDGNVKIYYDHEVGDEVYCEDCEQEFQILSLDPIRLESLDVFDDYDMDEDDEY